MDAKALAAGLLVGAALTLYLTHRHRAASRDRDPSNPHLPALPSPEERHERVLDQAERLRELREGQAA